MKLITVVLIIFFIPILLFSLEQSEFKILIDSSPALFMEIFSNRITIQFKNIEKGQIETYEGDNELEADNGLTFFKFQLPSGVFPREGQIIKSVEPGIKKWMLLKGVNFDYTTIYEADIEVPIYWRSTQFTERSNRPTYTATSHLTENGIEYGPENLKDNRTGRPWVEGVPGDGVGEKIFLTYQRFPSEGFSHLLLSNGFVSYDNPSLYGKNGRLKRIRVEDRESDFFQEFDIEDTPNYQILELDRPLKTITVEILEVYPGSRWDDTCVNLLEPVWPQL